MQLQRAPAHVGTSHLRKMGGFPRGTQWGVLLGRALSFATSFCTSRKKWRPRRVTKPPAGEQARLCGAPGRRALRSETEQKEMAPPQGVSMCRKLPPRCSAKPSPRKRGKLLRGDTMTCPLLIVRICLLSPHSESRSSAHRRNIIFFTPRPARSWPRRPSGSRPRWRQAPDCRAVRTRRRRRKRCGKYPP